MALVAKLRVVCVAVSLLNSVLAGTRGWSASEILDPSRTPGCRAGGVGDRLCDPEGLIPLEAAEQLQVDIHAFENGMPTPSACKGGAPGSMEGPRSMPGMELAVLVVSRISRPSEEDIMDDMEKFARAVHARWGVGTECGNGVLVVFSIEQRALHISTGKAAAALLTDLDVRAIISRLKKPLRAGDYGGAVLQAVNDIRAVLSSIQNLPHDPQAPILLVTREMRRALGGQWWQPGSSLGGLLDLVFGIVPLLVMLSIGVWCRRAAVNRQESSWQQCRDRLLQVERLRAEAAAAAAAAGTGQASSAAPGSTPESTPGPMPRPAFASSMTCCPICLDDFITQAQVAGQQTPQPAAQAQTLTLACGHRFHLSCIDGWMGSEGGGAARNSCPVCRHVAYRSGDEDGDGGGGGGGGNASNGSDSTRPPAGSSYGHAPRGSGADCGTATGGRQGQAGGGGTADAMLQAMMRTAEANFLLGAVGRRYPAFVTPQMMNRWTGGGAMGLGLGLGMGGFAGLGGMGLGGMGLGGMGMGHMHPLAADADFVRANPQATRPGAGGGGIGGMRFRSGGPSGFSSGGGGGSSFGGGNSRGGGGGGGTW